jgi:hypothetical protein
MRAAYTGRNAQLSGVATEIEINAEIDEGTLYRWKRAALRRGDEIEINAEIDEGSQYRWKRAALRRGDPNQSVGWDAAWAGSPAWAVSREW